MYREIRQNPWQINGTLKEVPGQEIANLMKGDHCDFLRLQPPGVGWQAGWVTFRLAPDTKVWVKVLGSFALRFLGYLRSLSCHLGKQGKR